MSKLTNKIAVVTGGNSGIGLASARRFKAEGAKVIINARNAQRLEETKQELGDEFTIIQADFSKVNEIEAFFKEVGEQHGKIDTLYLNAGIALFMPIEAMTEEVFDQMVSINVKGVFFGVQKALPYLNDGASILLTTSVVNQMGMPNSNIYAATKAAVKSLAKSLSSELLQRNIRVNAISPGPIETPIFAKMGMDDEQMQSMASGIISQIPMGRMGRSEEVAGTALFLASDDSTFIVGAEIEVDGGIATL